MKGRNVKKLDGERGTHEGRRQRTMTKGRRRRAGMWTQSTSGLQNKKRFNESDGDAGNLLGYRTLIGRGS